MIKGVVALWHELMKRDRALGGKPFRTANENDMRLSAALCTANIAGVADGEWALISPYGDHAAPDGSYTQHFDRPQAEKVVATWNSITGRAARLFKNVMHGLGPKSSTPVWEGHPETDRLRWPKDKLLAEVTDIRTGHDGLEGRVTWNAKGAATRTRGPLFPSALWWHWPPAGTPPAVFPELLESIGLVATPNISGVPAWTANAHFVGFDTPFAGDPQADNQNQNQNQNDMNPEQLLALRKALNLPETADAATIISTANAALQLTTANAALVTERDALATANAALTTERDNLQTANATLTTERDSAVAERNGLTTANTALTTANAALRTGVLNLAEKKGAITPAEREGFQTRLATANTAADALRELPDRKAMNTTRVEINGSRVDITTANARADVITTAVAKRMKDDACDHSTAYAKVKADPMFAAVFAAMADPTRKDS